MSEHEFKIPFYARFTLILIGISAFSYAMYIAQDIIIPIVFATIIAILLNPVVNYLVRKRWNRMIAIALAVFLAVCLVSGVLYLVSTQLAMFSETFPLLREKFGTVYKEMVQWTSEKFSIRQSKINLWMNDSQSEAINEFAIGEKISEVGRMLVIAMLLPVYLVMILYYKPLLLEFIQRLFHSQHHIAVGEILRNSKKIIQTYLAGIFFEIIIIAVMNSAGLLLLGIEYAIILGIIGAILNTIPYIGGVIAAGLSMAIAFVTKDTMIYPLLVLGLYLLIQFIDNNYIIPKIVSSRVQLNALTSIVVVLLGGALWGIPGMFLSIPLTAIVKVVFDHIEPLKPWGFLLGNIVPTVARNPFSRR
ncbi:MAG TPA: AI-2E family transporter [Bacteroidia bacterium]|nr:AI-2E family transporter [Bacteroidia bacterium]